MTEFKEHAEVKIGSERNFGTVFTCVFIFIALFPLFGGGPIRIWALAVGGLFFVATLLFPHILQPLNHVWFRFGLLLGRIVAPVVMSAVFLIAVTPTALIMRVLGKDPLRRKFTSSSKSYWQQRDETTNPMGSMKNQF